MQMYDQSTQGICGNTNVPERINRDYPSASNEAMPQPKSLNQIRGINIRQLSYGYIVDIGCQTFAFENMDKVIASIAQYMRAPDETEKNWNEKGAEILK